MTRGAFPIYPMCYLQDSNTRGGCAAYATTRQGKKVRDCVCFRVGGCFGCSWEQVSFNFATIRPQHLSQPAAHHSPCSIPSPSPSPPSAPPTHVSSLQPHLPSRQPLFGVFLSRSRFRSGIQHYPKSVQKHNMYLSCVAFSSFYNNHLLLLSLQIFRYSPPRRLFNNPTKPSSPIYLHTLFFYHFPSPATRSFLSSLFSPVIVHKSRVQALFGSFI